MTGKSLQIVENAIR